MTTGKMRCLLIGFDCALDKCMHFAPMVVKQMLRFGLVGVASNLVIYLLYLFITTAGIGPKTAMTVLFAIGALQTFFFNKRWTFVHSGYTKLTFVKYVFAYCIAYLLNLMAMVLFVDCWHLSHQIVQAVMIVLIALILFCLQKFWIFASP